MSGLPARRKVEERTGGNDAVTEHAAGNHVDDSEASAAPFDPDAWKAFGRDTEAGRMLSKLYGTGSKPKIDYPKPKVKPRDPATIPAYMPAGGKHDTDYRTAKRKDVDISIPHVGHGSCREYAPIELRAGQGVMLKEDIDKRLEEAEKSADKAFPPIKKAIHTEAEKRRLQAAFQFKGGKALPEELTLAPIEGHIPLSVVTGTKRGMRQQSGGSHRDPSPIMTSADLERQAVHDLILEISEEISERQKHLEDMKRLGSLTREREGTLLSEISQRVAELNRLNSKLI